MRSLNPVTIGVFLTVAYTMLISSADGITKLIASAYEAPQLFCLSGLIVVGFCLICERHPSQRGGLKTSRPLAMAVRSVATIFAAVSFFYAFALLPFADVFLFVALMPVIAAMMSGVILGERVSPLAWGALAFGFTGVVFLFPAGLGSVSMGHVFASAAAVFGTLSIVMARYIGRFEKSSLALVFYPNLALALVMAAILPAVWQPMMPGDLMLILAYASFLFMARWVLVLALRHLVAYAVMPLMNLQFIWMVLIGAVYFNEVPGIGTYTGVAIVAISGLALIWDQYAPENVTLFGAMGRFRTDP